MMLAELSLCTVIVLIKRVYICTRIPLHKLHLFCSIDCLVYDVGLIMMPCPTVTKPCVDSVNGGHVMYHFH